MYDSQQHLVVINMCFILCSCRIANSDSLGDAGAHEGVEGWHAAPYMTKVVVQSLWRGEQVGWYKVRGPRVSAAAVPPLPAGTTCVPILLPAEALTACPPHLPISSHLLVCEQLLCPEKENELWP